MKPIDKCVVIKDVVFAALYSGEDVWIIPYDPITGEIKSCKLWSYVGDDWYIMNKTIYGYSDEPCYIAVEDTVKQIHKKFCKLIRKGTIGNNGE